LRAVDLLASRPDVDAAKISAIGKGGGGVPLLYAAALDERIQKLAFEQVLVSYRAVVEQRINRGVLESIIPGVLQQFDLGDLMTSLIPRKVWVINAANPLGVRLWPAAATKAYAPTADAFRRAGAAESFKTLRRMENDGPEAVYENWLA
jgi:hypothetical protein